MRASKFAPITASLLARKGEARPWCNPQAEQADFVERAPRPEPAFPLMLVQDDQGDTPGSKRITLRMTADEYAQLGVLATRQGGSRQKFLYAILRRILDGGMSGPIFGL